jgi:hypothetical protein
MLPEWCAKLSARLAAVATDIKVGCNSPPPSISYPHSPSINLHVGRGDIEQNGYSVQFPLATRTPGLTSCDFLSPEYFLPTFHPSNSFALQKAD